MALDNLSLSQSEDNCIVYRFGAVSDIVILLFTGTNYLFDYPYSLLKYPNFTVTAFWEPPVLTFALTVADTSSIVANSGINNELKL